MGWPLYCSDGMFVSRGCIIFPPKIGVQAYVDVIFLGGATYTYMSRWASRCVKVKIETPWNAFWRPKWCEEASWPFWYVAWCLSNDQHRTDVLRELPPLAQVLCRLKWAHDASVVPIYSRGKKVSYPAVFKHGNGKSQSVLDDFPIKT